MFFFLWQLMPGLVSLAFLLWSGHSHSCSSPSQRDTLQCHELGPSSDRWDASFIHTITLSSCGCSRDLPGMRSPHSEMSWWVPQDVLLPMPWANAIYSPWWPPICQWRKRWLNLAWDFGHSAEHCFTLQQLWPHRLTASQGKTLRAR